MTEEKKAPKREKKQETKKREEIELTIGEAEDILTDIHLEELKGKKLPVKTHYWLKKILRKLIDEMKEYFEKKQELAEKYSEKRDGEPVRDKGGNLTLDKNFIKEFQDVIMELRKEKFKLSGVYYLQIDLEDEAYAVLNGHDLDILYPLMEDAG